LVLPPLAAGARRLDEGLAVPLVGQLRRFGFPFKEDYRHVLRQAEGRIGRIGTILKERGGFSRMPFQHPDLAAVGADLEHDHRLRDLITVEIDLGGLTLIEPPGFFRNDDVINHLPLLLGQRGASAAHTTCPEHHGGEGEPEPPCVMTRAQIHRPGFEK